MRDYGPSSVLQRSLRVELFCLFPLTDELYLFFAGHRKVSRVAAASVGKGGQRGECSNLEGVEVDFMGSLMLYGAASSHCFQWHYVIYGIVITVGSYYLSTSTLCCLFTSHVCGV